eukprot:scaffold10972_cov59-Cylindrotheca_fusiformis.AAC.2
MTAGAKIYLTKNPYAKQLSSTAVGRSSLYQPQQQQSENRQSSQNAFRPPFGVIDPNSMGPPSQYRISSIKKCKQLGTLRKKRATSKISHFDIRQRAVNNIKLPAFHPLRDCRVCIAESKGKNLHRSHHVRCPRNRKTRGQSATEVEGIREDRRLATLMGGKMIDPDMERQLAGSSTPGIQAFFAKNDDLKEQDDAISTRPQLQGCSLPNEVSDFLERAVRDRKPSKLKCAASDAFVALAEAIMREVKHKKPTAVSRDQELPFHNEAFAAAHGRFQAIFGKNNMTFTVPEVTDLDRAVDPGFHSLAGAKFIYMDMEVAFPSLKWACCFCGKPDKLSRIRDIFSTEKRLFPVVEDCVEVWCLPFRYHCGHCDRNFMTNDGEFLASLPACIRNQYPVDPRYASPKRGKHLSKTLSTILHEDMGTFSTATEFVRKVTRRKNEHYLSRLEDYYSRPDHSGRYLDADDVVRTYSHTEKDCRSMHLEAELSPLNPERVAAKDRYERILQSAKIKELAAVDHTFATLKNYRLPGAKAVFTLMNEEGMICQMVCVPSEKIQDVDHMLQTMQKRRPQAFSGRFALYTDTWPKNKEYWDAKFGKSVEGRLGLFHFIQRLTEHFNPRHEDFFRAKDRLQGCVYQYGKAQLEALMDAFKDGRIGGKRLSLDEIESIRLSKAWSSNYAKYLPKEIFSGDEIARRLSDYYEWLHRHLDGDKTFFRTSEAQFKKQIDLNRETCHFIQDPEGLEMYVSVPASKRSKLQLATFVSKKPESKLEAMHGQMAHYANCGMRPELADTLTLRGASEHNQCREFRIHSRSTTTSSMLLDKNQPAAGESSSFAVPGYIADFPKFFNDMQLDYLNKLASSKGFRPHFPDCKVLPSNNGEKFLSDYFLQQQLRNSEGLVSSKDKRCTCRECLEPFVAPPRMEEEGETSHPTAACEQSPWNNENVLEEVDKEPAKSSSNHPASSGLPCTNPSDAAFPPPPATWPTAAGPPNHASGVSLLSTGGGRPLLVGASPAPSTITTTTMVIPHAAYYYQPPFFYGAMPPPMIVPIRGPSSHLCCGRFAEYIRRQERTGKRVGGRVPHDRNCPMKTTENRIGKQQQKYL